MTSTNVSSPVSQPPARTLWGDALRRFRRDRLAVAGLCVLALIILVCGIGPWIYKAPIDAISFARAAQGPSWDHPFGTNDLGQDVLARVLYGGRISLSVGLVSMLVAIGLGTLVGSLAGFYGGWVDLILMRITDLFLSLPQLPLLLLVIFLFRQIMRNLLGPETGIFVLIVLVIGGLNWMSVARLVRANVLSLREQDFVMAARSLGASAVRLLRIHIFPNLLSPIIVAATLSVGTAIITESTLSFLGLGFPPDVPTWGRLLYDARNYLEPAPHMAFFPGTAIFLTVLSINYVGDGLRDALDPRMRRG